MSTDVVVVLDLQHERWPSAQWRDVDFIFEHFVEFAELVSNAVKSVLQFVSPFSCLDPEELQEIRPRLVQIVAA